MNNEKERKDLMEAIRILLLSTEELKAAISPLIRDQKDVFKILRSHEEAITRLMDKLIGTQEEHKNTRESLDLLRTHISQVEESLESHKDVSIELEKRLKRLEFKEVISVLKKIVKKEQLSVTDLKFIEDVLSLYPDDKYLLSVKSEVLYGLGRRQEALEFLEDAISKYPNGARLWYVKGLLLKDFEERLKCFDKSLELLKDGPPLDQHLVLFARAALFASARRFEESLESANKSVEMYPDCYSAWLQKGMILTQLDRIPEALGCFEKAIELDTSRKEAWFEKGSALSALGLNYLDEAIAGYDKAIELDPKFAIAYFNKAKLLSMKEQDEKAVQTIDKGLEIDSKRPCPWCDRGAALNRLGRNEEAIESLKRALEIGPPKKCNQIFMNMAIVLYYLERYEEGVEFAKRIVEAEPENVAFWDVLACNLQGLGMDEEALKAFEKALSLRKSDEQISWDDLAKLYERMGRAEEAKQAYQKFKIIERKDGKHTTM